MGNGLNGPVHGKIIPISMRYGCLIVLFMLDSSQLSTLLDIIYVVMLRVILHVKSELSLVETVLEVILQWRPEGKIRCQKVHSLGNR